MTRYEQGFLNKCAEYGVDGRQVLAAMQKEAFNAGSYAAAGLRELPGAVERISPAVKKIPWLKILAALGIVGGGAGLAAQASKKSPAASAPTHVQPALAPTHVQPTAPAPITSVPTSGNKKANIIKALIALGVIGGVGGAAYGVSKAIGGASKFEEEDEGKNKKKVRS